MASIVDEHEYKGTWLESYYTESKLACEQLTSSDIYIISFYWTITTITTVGYGDISGTNGFEKVFCSIVMIIGVISFSLANGSLASIIQNYDSSNASH